MKFIIKTSAVAVSDSKFAKRGEYETEDQKEIERLKNTAQKFPNDVAEISTQSSKKKEESQETHAEETSTSEEPKEEPRRRR
jgi:hypothetical protein